MNTKQIKLSLVIGLSMYFLCSASSFAGESDSYGRQTQGTPYDQKVALAEVLKNPYQSSVNSPIQSVEHLFWKARRFSYSREKDSDDWQLPQETEKKQSGDCEDKALWLYAHLRAAGYKNLGLVVGKYRNQDPSYHVWVVRVDENGNAFILDPTIQNRIWPLKVFQSGFYQPLFLFDGNRRYRFF